MRQPPIKSRVFQTISSRRERSGIQRQRWRFRRYFDDRGRHRKTAGTNRRNNGWLRSQVENELEKQTRQVDANDKAKSATPAEIQKEQKEFEQAEDAIKQALFDLPQLSALRDSIKVEITDQGLQIQLLDQKGTSLFQPGSARLTGQAKKLILLVATIAQSLPNEITISGHTDSESFSGSNGRTNWELSLERANSARRELQTHRIPNNRIESVVGLADKLPLLADDPANPQNRRISIVLLREKREVRKRNRRSHRVSFKTAGKNYLQLARMPQLDKLQSARRTPTCRKAPHRPTRS